MDFSPLLAVFRLGNRLLWVVSRHPLVGLLRRARVYNRCSEPWDVEVTDGLEVDLRRRGRWQW